MAEDTRRYQPVQDEETMRLDEVLEPFDEPGNTGNAYAGWPYGGVPAPEVDEEQPYGENPYENQLYDDQLYEQPYNGGQAYADEPYGDGEAYSDYHEALDMESRARAAMGVFDTVSTLVGVVVILVLAAMLFSLVSWLQTDVLHSVALLQSGLQ